MKKKEREAWLQEQLNQVVNLILSPSIQSEERDLLVAFQGSKTAQKDPEGALVELAENLRLLSLRYLQEKKRLSPSVAAFYKQIATYGRFNRELGRGLISLTGFFSGGGP